MLQAADALADEPRLPRQGQREPARRARRADRGRRDRAQAARGLGHDAGGDRLLPRASPTTRRAGRDPHRHAERVRASSRTRSRRSRAARSTPTTPRAPAAGTRPTSSRSAASANVLPSSTNPTRPYTVNTLDEHLDMLMVCHHLDPRHPRGRRVRRVAHPPRDDRRRGHPARPRRLLDDLVGLAGDGPRRRGRSRARWQTAHKMKVQRGALPEDTGAQRQLPRQALRREVHDQPGDRARHRAARSARSRSASSPISCCGGRRSSASSRRWSSRAA